MGIYGRNVCLEQARAEEISASICLKSPVEKYSAGYIMGLQSTLCSAFLGEDRRKSHSSNCEHRQYELIVRAKTDFQPRREPEMTQSFGTSTGWVDDLNTSQAEIC